MRAVFSLVYLNGFANSHTDFTYDMFSISMQMAKKLGYEVVLFANTKSLDKLKDVADILIDVGNKKFHFYDDIKIHIWETLEGNDYFTIDGDVFLFNKLDFILKDVAIYCDEFYESVSDESLNSLKHFNSLNPSSVISEWDINNTKNLNTGIIKWVDDDFKKYFIESYNKLRNLYLKNTNYLNKNNLLSINRSVSSHILFENLLYQLLKSKKLKSETLSQYKLYSHLSGEAKFSNEALRNEIFKLKV